uniref:Secreted protein n=1 Tax=Heterorhabditis bacteriophora TaxID=37862 RepID=A0A1I7X5G7_HETBA
MHARSAVLTSALLSVLSSAFIEDKFDTNCGILLVCGGDIECIGALMTSLKLEDCFSGMSYVFSDSCFKIIS